ncbi:hypothetical protein CC78DRAFT_590799 [Lojkania enalia]|uniref:Uncharacterized protein n=1 Tax=Lojkania enalia TaxID=147567 RepID=A0A9P4MZ70_9PLEO|nr:hypothetical protein CC78DRAFT_590799 [Didymosphaeria enalia]
MPPSQPSSTTSSSTSTTATATTTTPYYWPSQYTPTHPYSPNQPHSLYQSSSAQQTFTQESNQQSQQQTPFQHYQTPTSQTGSSAEPMRGPQITAPFQIPRMPIPWPMGRGGGASEPLDMRSLGSSGRGYQGKENDGRGNSGNSGR